MESRKALSHQLKILLGMLVLFAVLIVLLSVDITGRAQSVSEIKTDIASAIGASDVVALLRRDAASAAPFIPVIENILPVKDGLVVFANDAKDIAEQYRVSANVRFRGESKKTETALFMTEITIDAQGSFANIMKFIEALKKSKYFVKIESADITRASGEDVRASLSGIVFSI